MGNNIEISVKVKGRPVSNAGYQSIYIYNNPQFDIQDSEYVGFDVDENSYFYSIRREDKYTIYKIIRNRVQSCDGNRLSTFKIAFSIPKGYKLDGCTPYDVLKDLKDEFIKKCLRCVDSTQDVYRYVSDDIGINILDDVSKKYALFPVSYPYRIMKPGGPIGYIIKNDCEIERFFHDVNYPEFEDYSEVLIAEHVGQTSYSQISNIQIPRPKNYELWVDGVKKGNYTNLNDPIPVTSKKISDYYDNVTKSFTVQNLKDLKDGDFIEGVELQEDYERIIVSTANWATPKRRNIKLRIVPAEYEKEIFAHPNWVRVIKKGIRNTEIQLSNDFSFTLVGEQIAEIRNRTIELELTSEAQKRFRVTGSEIYGDELRATVEIKPQVVRETVGIHGNGKIGQHHSRTNNMSSANSSPVCDVTIKLNGKDKFDEKSKYVKIKLESNDGVRSTCTTRFSKIANTSDEYEGHLYVSKDYKEFGKLELKFSIKNSDYVTTITPPDLNNDEIQIWGKNFKINKKNWIKKNINVLIFLAIFLTTLLLGFFVGYSTHDTIKQGLIQTESNDTTIDDNPFSMNEEEAIKFLESADKKLKSKELSFADVEELFKKYMSDTLVIKEYDISKFEGKVCDRIDDYYEIVCYIQNGDFDKIKESINKYDNKALHIWDYHAKILRKIIGNESSFRNNYSKIQSFDRIEENIKDESGEEPTPTPLSPSPPSSTASSQNSTTSRTSANTQTQKWVCEQCKNAGERLNTWDKESDYKRHMEKLHKER